MRAVENVGIFEEIGLVGDDLLYSERPLLIPRTRQAKRLVPRRKLHGARPRLLRQDNRQHFEKDAIDVVLGLLLGQPQRVHLDAVAEAAELRVRHAVAVLANLVPEIDEGAHLAHLGDEAHARVHEERNARHRLTELGLGDLAARLHRVEHGDGDRERIGKLLHRRRACLLQMIGADIGRVPFRNLAEGEDHDVLDEPHRRLRRKHIGAARQIFLDDVVLNRSGQQLAVDALFVGEGDVQRKEPRRRRVDRHRRVHLAERDTREQRAHIAEVAHRHANLADLAARKRVIGVISRLRRQVEGDGKARLPLGQVLEIKLV